MKKFKHRVGDVVGLQALLFTQIPNDDMDLNHSKKVETSKGYSGLNLDIRDMHDHRDAENSKSLDPNLELRSGND